MKLILESQKYIHVVTVQGIDVIDTLKAGKTYIADYNNIRFAEYKNQYKKLSELLGFKNCPIFCAPVGNQSSIEASNVDANKNTNKLYLRVPESELRYTEYYDWSDYLYYTHNPEEAEDGLIEYLENHMLSSSTNLDTPQIVLDRIEPEWIER